MKEGDLVLAAIPQVDGSFKTRPALVLRELPPFGDMLICGISTQLRHEVIGFDELISIGDPDFAQSGLRQSSLIRLAFLDVLHSSMVIGKIGTVSPALRLRLLHNLADHLLG